MLLNSSYEPLRVISWQRAIGLQFCAKIQVVETYDAVVRSPSTELPVPAVARLLIYAHARSPGIKFCRKNVFLRDDYRCQYCGASDDTRELTFDHVMPRSRGGPTSWENIVTACVPCNRAKGHHTPEEAGLVLAAKPRRPTWLPGVRAGLHIGGAPLLWQTYLQAA